MNATETSTKRRFKAGTVDREGVFINAEIDAAGELHITADIYRSGHDVGGGQAIETVERLYLTGNIDKGTSYSQLTALCSIWREWHLNHMRAGCEHQRALGWKSYDDHPSEPCPVCGYNYGSAWLKEELPADVIAFIESLPEA